MKKKYVKLVVFVPVTHAEVVRSVLSKNGCGKMGAYDSCSFSVRGVGRFRPLEGSHPHSGKIGEVEEVEEERIETVCPHTKVEQVCRAIREVHPYEHPAFDVFELLNGGDLL